MLGTGEAAQSIDGVAASAHGEDFGAARHGKVGPDPDAPLPVALRADPGAGRGSDDAGAQTMALAPMRSPPHSTPVGPQ
jgi:hypothetical protein